MAQRAVEALRGRRDEPDGARQEAEPWMLSEAQKCPSGEVPLVFVPVGTPGGHPSK